MDEYKWDQCSVTISNYDDSPSGYWAVLEYDRQSDKVFININGRYTGMATTLPKFREQLASWFSKIEEKRKP